jgi:uncharacterized protein (TIGR00299 family) protein
MPPEPIANIHLDPLGGIAGDMLVACLLDAFPELERPLLAALRAAGLHEGVTFRRVPHRDHGLAGSRLVVDVPQTAAPSGRHGEIARRIAAADLPEGARARALAIYRLLAEAEARVHGVPVEAVHFHELADWDSFGDIVAAAWLIDRLAAESWSCGPLPLGGGRVRGAHGVLPVPAPATALLLEGLSVFDDGIGGERVTPTGAAILRHLQPAAQAGDGRIARAGMGFGTRLLDGIPNLLRALVIGPADGAETERIGVLRFEIDDQTPEDLAIALDRLRALSKVRDVCQWPAIGKKGRLLMAVQVLCAPEAVQEVAAACLAETATIGLRWRLEQREVLPREAGEAAKVRVKRVRRPDGHVSVKAEAGDIAETGGYAERAARRREAEG